MLSTTASYLAIVNNTTAQQAAVAREPQTKSATAYYLANIGKVTSIKEFTGDSRLLNYALKAYGLEDQTDAKGLITKVLEGGVSSSKSLANTLSDQRWRAFAKAYDFAGQGAAATAATGATTGATALYTEQTLEDQAGTTNAGVQLALYFTRQALRRAIRRVGRQRAVGRRRRRPDLRVRHHDGRVQRPAAQPPGAAARGDVKGCARTSTCRCRARSPWKSGWKPCPPTSPT